MGHTMGSHWFLQMVYLDDLHGVSVGEQKFLQLWIWVLAFELIGTPFGYHKFKRGFASNFVGFIYDLCQVGISEKRSGWLCNWIDQAGGKGYVVAAQDFSEFLGRLGFVSQLLTWLKPHLAPLYSWAAAVAPGTVEQRQASKDLDVAMLATKNLGIQDAPQSEPNMPNGSHGPTSRPKWILCDRIPYQGLPRC